MNSSECPVCKARLSSPTKAPDTRTWTINCPRCGLYLLTFEAERVLATDLRGGLRWAITSHAIRRMFSADTPHKVTIAWLDTVRRLEKLPSPQQQADTFVKYLGAADVPSGHWVRCDPQRLTGLLGTADDPTRGETGGFVFVVKNLKNKGLIEDESRPDPHNPGTAGYRLTFEGWERFEQLRNGSQGHEKEEWITAKAALTLLGTWRHGNRMQTICKRAHAGLIKARARRFVRDSQVRDNVDIPIEFWWAEGRAALSQNWETGDFETWINQRVHLQAFGVTFLRTDIEQLMPAPPGITAALDEPKSGKSEGPGRASASSDPMALPVAVVLTAIEAETQAVLRHLADRRRQRVSDTWFHTGQFEGWTIAVAEAGPGNASAATIATRALAYFKPHIAAFVGVAGGVKDVALGDVVIATKVYGYESGKETPDGFSPRPDVQKSHHELEQRARVLRSDTMWQRRLDDALWSDRKPRVYIEPIAAGEAVLAAVAGRIATLLRKHYSDVLAVEMEGRGFLEAAHIESGCRAVVVRGISDLLKGKAKTDKLGWQRKAADAAAAFFFEMLLLDEGAPRRSSNPNGELKTQHTLVIDVPNTSAARFLLKGNSNSGKLGLLFYNLRIVNSLHENVTIKEVILRYELDGKTFISDSHVLQTGIIRPPDKADVNSIIVKVGPANIILMNWKNLREEIGEHKILLPGGVLAASAAYVLDIRDVSDLARVSKFMISIMDYSGNETVKELPLEAKWIDQANMQIVENRRFMDTTGKVVYLD